VGYRGEACPFDDLVVIQNAGTERAQEVDSIDAMMTDIPATQSFSMPAAGPIPLPWFAVRVKPNFEKVAAASLDARGFEQFLPTYRQKRQWSDRVKNSELPLFPGYLFCRLDAEHRTPVLAAPGVIGIVSCGPQLVPVGEKEIEAVRRIMKESLPVEPWPYLHHGCRVRVACGALTGVEGLVIREQGNCRLILQISLLQRSVSLQIDRHSLEPILLSGAAYV
jgi:transcription antitermination factor NusG